MTRALIAAEGAEVSKRLAPVQCAVGVPGGAEALAFGRAHVLVYQPRSTRGTFGSVQLYRGRGDQCWSNNWALSLSGGCPGNPDCIDSLDMAAYAFPTHRVRLRVPGTAATSLCFEPDGDMFVMRRGVWTTTPPAGTEGVRFTLERLRGPPGDGGGGGACVRVLDAWSLTAMNQTLNATTVAPYGAICDSYVDHVHPNNVVMDALVQQLFGMLCL